MAGTLIVSNLKTDTDNSFIVRSNTGTTLFVANTTGIDVANSFASSSITSDKILTVANTQISGNIISSQITSVANTQLTGTITGSQISSNTLSNTVFQTGSVENYMNSQNLGFGMRNRIINGAMVIDQRNAGASVTPVNDQYSVDRWGFPLAQASKLSFQQNANSVTPPAGFINYLGITSLSAYSITSTDYFLLQQRIEGLNMADFDWGTANASTVTLSFWVRSSLTGTFSGSLSNASFNRSYPFSYTISSANTWEYKTITITGDTSGTWLTTNGIGINLRVTMGSGSTRLSTGGSWQAGNYDGVTGTTSVVGTNGATFYITGVQLEKGSTATSFDYRPYGTELQLCQRYFFSSESGQYITGKSDGGTNWFGSIVVPVALRASPSVSFSANPTIRLYTVSGYKDSTTNSVSLSAFCSTSIALGFSGFTSIGDNYVANARVDGANILISAEL